MTAVDPSAHPVVTPNPVPTFRVGLALAVSAPIWAITLAVVGDDEGFGLSSLVGGVAGFAFQFSLLALLAVQYRTRAMGTGRVARVGYRIEFALIGGALVSTFLDMFWLIQDSVVWAIFDSCWPLSMLGMAIIGIRIAIAGRWTGALRWQTLFAQCWFLYSIPLVAVPAIGLWGAAAFTILGYGGLGVLLARRRQI
ncbi:hypothetical protein V1Y59_17580 [Gordonia sp. PKS22-38]|uniref:Uncharacterized protein n=1 Tax=Gordonia prachuapensis TaxID=3115651 RepID=A0ABU7MX42_9ACTN|nr:hypothetical protein [Gordonia sp. PKS22-38]